MFFFFINIIYNKFIKKIFYDPSGTNVGPCVTKRPVFWNILI